MENIVPILKFKNGKLYVAPNPKGKIVRRAMELLEIYSDKRLTERDVDLLCQFLSDLYGNQFNINDIYEDVEKTAVISTVFGGIQAVVEMLAEAAKSKSGTNAASSGPPITSAEAVDNLYREILKKDWSLYELDESDFFALLGLLTAPAETHYIDEVL